MTLTCQQALLLLYDVACHHPRCIRGNLHECSCGVSAALEHARGSLLMFRETQGLDSVATLNAAVEAIDQARRMKP